MQQSRRVTLNKILIIMLCLVSHSLARGQTFNRDQIVGVWTSREVSLTKPVGQKPVENATVEKMKRGLTNSQFIFRPNGLFFLKLPANAPAEFRELEAMNNKMWHIKT